MEIFNVIFGAISIILGYLTYKLNSEKDEREKTLEKFKDFAKGTIMFDFTYIDAIMIGPPKSGKTSIAQLWTSPWTQIGNYDPSVKWQVYEKDIYEFDEEDRRNPDISINQTYQPILRLRLHDYPGEDKYRSDAIKELGELGEKAVLIFVFHVEFANNRIQSYTDNASYFSLHFVQTVENQIKNISNTVAKAIVVFNKADLLPENWSEKKAIDELKKANSDAIRHIEGLFSGILEYHLTSVLTNKGLFKLLGSIGSAGIESKRDLKSFRQYYEQIQKQHGIEKG